MPVTESYVIDLPSQPKSIDMAELARKYGWVSQYKEFSGSGDFEYCNERFLIYRKSNGFTSRKTLFGKIKKEPIPNEYLCTLKFYRDGKTWEVHVTTNKLNYLAEADRETVTALLTDLCGIYNDCIIKINWHGTKYSGKE